MPTELSNEFFYDITNYASDHLPFRDSLIAIKTLYSQKLSEIYSGSIAGWISDALGEIPPKQSVEYSSSIDIDMLVSGLENGDPACKHVYIEYSFVEPSIRNEGYRILVCELCNKKIIADAVSRTTLEEFNQTVNLVIQNKAFSGKHDWIFFAGDNTLISYAGLDLFSEEQLEYDKSLYKKLKAICDEKGIKLVIEICPNKEYVYSEYMPDNVTKYLGKHNAELLEEYLEDSNIEFVYPLEELKAAKILYDPYHMQDTHWNGYGAYIGVLSIYKKLGFEVSSLFNTSIIDYSNTGGDLSTMLGKENTYTTYTVSYKPEVSLNWIINKTAWPYVYYCESNNQTTRNLLVVGDSFAEVQVQFLAKDFAKTCAIHSEKLYSAPEEVIEFISSLGDGDVLVISNIERFLGLYHDNKLETIINILK